MSNGNSAAEAEQFLSCNPDITSIQTILSDSTGVGRGKSLRRSELAHLYTQGRLLPGSLMGVDITGADVVETGLIWEDGDPDRICYPVPGTLQRAPWLNPPAAQVLITMHELDGSPVAGDPRHALQRVVDRFKDLNLTPVVAIELEFYIIDRQRDGMGKPQPPASPLTGRRPHHLDPCSLDDLADQSVFLADLLEACATQGLPVQTLISEYAPGQLEIGLLHRDDALRAVDEAIMYKRLVRGVASKHGFDATFMAKPYADRSGSGMHVHVSLEDARSTNVFASGDPEGTPLMRHAIAGMAATMAESVGIFAPNANSYRRFRRNSYVPLAPSWGVNNRAVSLRIPTGSPDTRHIEHRVAGADANPYIATAAVLAGAHHGIVNRLDPGPPIVGNAYEQLAPSLPMNWHAALELTAASGFLQNYLGERFLEIYTAIKRAEQDRFFAQVPELDFDWCMRSA